MQWESLWCDTVTARFLLGCKLIIFGWLCCFHCKCLPSLSKVTQVKCLKGNLYNACLCPDAESWLMQNGGWSGHMCMWNIYSALWKQIRKYNLSTLDMSFNTAFTLLLSFTCVNLIFRSFDHEKRSWQEQLFSKNLKKNYLSAVSNS